MESSDYLVSIMSGLDRPLLLFQFVHSLPFAILFLLPYTNLTCTRKKLKESKESLEIHEVVLDHT